MTKKPNQSTDDIGNINNVVTINRKYELVTNENLLLEKEIDGCIQSITALWQLPIERSDAVPLVNLPTFAESRIPHALVSFFVLRSIYVSLK